MFDSPQTELPVEDYRDVVEKAMATQAFCAGRREVAPRRRDGAGQAFCCPARTISVFTPTKAIL
jgi:hypothetical protein